MFEIVIIVEQQHNFFPNVKYVFTFNANRVKTHKLYSPLRTKQKRREKKLKNQRRKRNLKKLVLNGGKKMGKKWNRFGNKFTSYESPIFGLRVLFFKFLLLDPIKTHRSNGITVNVCMTLYVSVCVCIQGNRKRHSQRGKQQQRKKNTRRQIRRVSHCHLTTVR